MSDPVFNISPASLTLGAVLARGLNNVTLYKAELLQGQTKIQVRCPHEATGILLLAILLTTTFLQVAVKQFNLNGASAAAELQLMKEIHIAQVASASCQRACRMLGCCKQEGNLCLVMSLYSSSAAKRIETLQGMTVLASLL